MKEEHSAPGIVKVDRVDGGRSEAHVQRWLAAQRLDLERAIAACESPIEAMFATALLASSDNDGPFFRRVDSVPGDKQGPIARGRAGALYLQYPLILDARAVRLDFAIILGKKRLAIETDGHDFHEKTKQQAASDKSRDRLLTAAGWKLLRFAGSEVYADAGKCAGEALAVLGCVAVLRKVGKRSAPLIAPVDGTSALSQLPFVPVIARVNPLIDDQPRAPGIGKVRNGAAGVLSAILGIDSENSTFDEIQAALNKPFVPRPRQR